LRTAPPSRVTFGRSVAAFLLRPRQALFGDSASKLLHLTLVGHRSQQRDKVPFLVLTPRAPAIRLQTAEGKFSLYRRMDKKRRMQRDRTNHDSASGWS